MALATAAHGARLVRVKAVLDRRTYDKGVKVTDDAMHEVRLRRHRLHPDWNYTIDHHALPTIGRC
jgi:hypothetical protein